MSLAPILISLLVMAQPGKAPSAEEQRLFDEGMRAYQAGDARAAETAWKAGYRIGRDPAFLIRIGEAEEKAGDPAEAAESYRHYLREAADAADRVEIEQRIARLTGGGAAPAAGAPAAPESEAGNDADSEIPGAFGDAPAPAAPPPAPGPRAGKGEAARHHHADEEPSGWNALNITAWIATAAAVAMLGTAGYYAASAGSKKDDVNLLIRYRDEATGAPLEYHAIEQRYLDATREGQHDDRVAKAALLAAGGAAVVAAVFFVLDEKSAPAGPEKKQAPSLGFALYPEAGKATALSSLRWTF